jgi:hypothetical protein
MPAHSVGGCGTLVRELGNPINTKADSASLLTIYFLTSVPVYDASRGPIGAIPVTEN